MLTSTFSGWKLNATLLHCFLGGNATLSLCFQGGNATLSLCFQGGNVTLLLCFQGGNATLSLCFQGGNATSSLCFQGGNATLSLCFQGGNATLQEQCESPLPNVTMRLKYLGWPEENLLSRRRRTRRPGRIYIYRDRNWYGRKEANLNGTNCRWRSYIVGDCAQSNRFGEASLLECLKVFLLSIDSSCRCNTSDLLTTPVFLLQFS